MNFIFLIQFKYEKHSYCLSTVYFLSLSPLTQRVFYAIKKLINYPLATNYSDIEVMNNFNFQASSKLFDGKHNEKART